MVDSMSVYRVTPLSTGALRGEFLLAESVIAATRDALTVFARAGSHEDGHEGIVYWAGRELGTVTVFLSAVVLDAEHSPQRVMVSRAAVGHAARAARAAGVGMLAQVHSHPGTDARHSEGDDQLVLLPFEGMLSVVVPHYGVGFDGLERACVHQFQEGRWVLCSSASVRVSLRVVPSCIDGRATP